MCAFDKIIGYETIKQEMKQICDMIHNPDIYQSLGAKLPHGLLLYGEPGLGKSLMSQCFMEESGLETYTIRRNKNSNDFIGEITWIFQTAKEHAPAIVFLDDIDKFANEDDRHKDAEEYVAVQAGIDEVRDVDVFVLATANDIEKLIREKMQELASVKKPTNAPIEQPEIIKVPTTRAAARATLDIAVDDDE